MSLTISNVSWGGGNWTWGATQPQILQFEYLLVAGGGGGGDETFINYCGGGGAGGVVNNLVNFNYPNTYIVTIGAGGTNNVSGSNSSIIALSPADIVAIGGGNGDGSGGVSSPGGSAGGGNSNALQPTSASGGFGNSGAGGGGGGAGTASANAFGGFGKLFPAFTNYGTNVTNSVAATDNKGYFGGGGGQAGGLGGVGGGGDARGSINGFFTPGIVNTGGGGGGASYRNGIPVSGMAGGSGVVILRAPVAANVIAVTTGSPNVTVSSGNTYYNFWQSGTIKFTFIG